MRMRGVSLRARVTLTGVAIVTVLVLAVNAFVYLSLRDRLLSNLELVLDAREQLAAELGREYEPEPLSEP
jgi:apolipoprotein N-acyltransferase